MINITGFILMICSSLFGSTTPEGLSTTIFPLDQIDTLEVEVVEASYTFKYKLNEPEEVFNLDEKLLEISGLSISDSGKHLFAVQDENGLIFKLSKKGGEVLSEIKFHKDGDYEGIEVVGDDIYVVKSTGTVYHVTNLGKPEQQMKKFNSFLGRENDVEGLAFDRKNNRLLLACKGIPATGESFEVIRYKKVIYAFDIPTRTLLPEPVYTLQLDDICKYLRENPTLKKYAKLVSFFSAEKENLTFNPSAIAVHPLTGNIYVISSSGKILIVMDEKGKVVHIEKLDKAIHAQPEGMVFDQDGTLFISNEGKKTKPKIYRFAYGS